MLFKKYYKKSVYGNDSSYYTLRSAALIDSMGNDESKSNIGFVYQQDIRFNIFLDELLDCCSVCCIHKYCPCFEL